MLFTSVPDEDDELRENFEKRHIGSLARLGLLPSFRYSGGRYSRSGRARLLLPSQELYRSRNVRISLCRIQTVVMCFSILGDCLDERQYRGMINVTSAFLLLMFRIKSD